MKSKEVGNFGEAIARDYLICEGYEILEKNFRCRIGEVDIIAKKDKVIVFIEVKTRTNEEYGRPCEAIDNKKITTIKKVAGVYLLSNNYNDVNVRYDVFEVYCNQIKDAF